MKSKAKSKTKVYVAIGVAIAAVIAGVTVSLTINSNSAGLKNTAPESITTEGLKVGTTAPDFSLADPQKGSITKQNFEGKPLFIFFTTTWCTPCQIGAQNLARYDDETGSKAFNVLIIFVDDRETDNQFVEWKNKFGRDDWYVAKGIEMAQTYKVKYLDTKYVFDNNGVIRWVDFKPLEYSSIGAVMRPLLGA